jgi:potassium-dependent mechanosensitive channel
MHGRIEAISKEVQEIKKDHFLLTVKALVTTLLLAAMWPAFLLLIQRRVLSAGPDDHFISGVAFDIRRLAFVIFVLSFLRHLVVPHGLAQDHFRMREESVTFLRRHLFWLSLVIIPAFYIVQVMNAQEVDDQWYRMAGRLFFMVGLGGLAIFFAIVLHPGLPFMKSYFEQQRGGWLERLRYLWYPLCVLVPLSYVVLAGMGYLYGARNLNERLLQTIVIVVFALLVRAIFVRWLTIARRKLAILEREKQRAIAAEEKTKEDTASKSTESSESKGRQEQTIFEMSRQTRRFINAVTLIFLVVGIWYIWRDILPAFAIFGKAKLWKTTSASGRVQTITLGSLMTAILISFLTVVVARNAPGLLEIIILRRLPLDRGVRFAIITVSRYILIVVGVILAFTSIGIGWSKVQWMVAAMTVGLGFGLQEIFANFISGLIILFEQPIRVDDVVTISDVTGTVTNIRIRATTIRKWDQKELIVPNKEFMTGRLINWTLTDSVLRMDFAVGVAYGSDIEKTERLLYKVAGDNKKALKDPKPVVVFKSFGSSSLDFELRVYISGMDSYVPVWHEINCAIDRTFREAGIEIAFPQRDIHIRSISGDISMDLKGGPDSVTHPST